MKKIAIVVGVLMLSSMAFAADSWTGYITDAKCAATGNEKMVTNAECSKKCVAGGEKAVLVSDGKVVKIANQDKIKEHVGHHVTVTGTLDGDTLTVKSVKMVEDKKM